MLKQLIAQLTRIASAMETANVIAEAHNRLIADKNELSQRVLTVQQQLLECERERTVVHVEPNIGEITTEVGKELAKRARAARGPRA